MQYPKGPDSSDCGTTLSRSRSRSRGTSISSDSQFSRLNIFSPPSVDPLPSFIAPSSASQIVTTDQEFNTADFVPDEDSDSGALVTPDALSALNGFLDHLLFNILAAAKSTQLALIRPAVAEVLKPRLAKELVSLADEELSEYLGGPEDEQADFGGGQSPDGEFDLIRTWKLTRLRCMVYTRLGDLEEDDEEEYIAQQGLADDEGASRRFGHRVGNITPPTAIFLTSIVEHIGEQALVIAGETARSRLSSKFLECDDNQDGVKERGRLNRLVVEELDVEKLALNPTLGRLWRTWRKRTRTPQLSRMASRDSIMRRGTIGHLPHSRKSSFSVAEDAQSQTTPLIEAPAEVDPASIPLPINENDVQEIDRDVPQDVESGEIQTMQAVVAHKVRPHSLMVLNLLPPKTPSPQGGSPATPDPHTPVTPVTLHARSRSLPSPTSPPDQEVPEEPAQTARKPSSTASEERRRLETMYEQEERDETERVEENEVERTVSKTESPPERRIDEMPTSALPVAVHASSSEPNAKSPRTPVQEVRPSLDSLRDKASNSGDSATSTYSRPYHRPAPLVVSSGSQRSATSVSTSGTERAAVQRISAQPASARSSPHTTTHADPRRSDSFSSQREKRPVTAGSAASQVSSKLKGLITKPSEPAPLRLRSSSESSRTRGATEDSYDDTRGLDELIRSEETLHYTLTPRSVREMDVSVDSFSNIVCVTNTLIVP
ncbi:hypothetical protein BJX61DRAFT_415054 [Aspergillus egyptiacus]|nr:hypothetical protein BJX61DRAFT_415054 [Aspergillus egyptiacus]